MTQEKYVILNSLPDSVTVIDQNHQVIFANQALLDLYEKPIEEIVGTPCHTLFHKSSVPCQEHSGVEHCPHWQVFQSGKNHTTTHTHLLANGTVRKFEISCSPLPDENDGEEKILLVMRDISALLAIKEKAEKSAQDLRRIFNSAPFSITYVDRQLVVKQINSTMEKFHGIKSAEVIGQHCYEGWGQYADSPKPKACDACKVMKSMSDGKIRTHERQIGSTFYEIVSAPVFDGDTIVGAMEIGNDITTRKEVEINLRRYMHIISTTNDLMSFISRDHIFLAVNDAYCEAFGKSREEIVGYSMADLLGPDFVEKVVGKYIDCALGGEQITFETWVDYPKAGRRYIKATYYPYVESEGVISGVVVNVHNITERKLADEALAEEAAISKSMSYLAQALIEARSIDEISTLVLEQAQKFTKSKDGYCGFIKASTGHLICPTLTTDIGKDCRVENKVVGQISVANGTDDYTKKDQLLLERLASMYALAIQRVRSEELLRKSETKYNYLYNHLGDAAFIINPATSRFIDINEVAVRRLGYSREELLLMSPYQINAPQFAEGIEECLRQPLKQGVYSFESVHVSKSGRQFPVEVSARIITLSGQPAIFALARDITKRKEAEERASQHRVLLQQLTVRIDEIEEGERQQLARELHDGAGQNLTALGLNLQILQNSFTPEQFPDLQYRLEDSKALVQQITAQTRDVMADLRSPVLEDYGLAAALRWYGEKVAARTGIEIIVREKPFLPLHENQLNTLFRIAKEAITNTVKHASAKKISLTVQDDGENFQLLIVDDGIGFIPEAVNALPRERHWGLITMQERVAALGGTFDLSSQPGQGTKIIVEVMR